MTACPLCAQTATQTLYQLPEDFETHRCGGCGFIFMAPRPTAEYLNAYYAQASVYGYASEVASDYAPAIADKVALIRRFQAAYPSLPKTGRALDFGAGNGAAVKAWAEAGYDAEGAEISEAARATALRLFGVKVTSADIGDVADDSLNLLTLFDVLEHLLEPRGFVETARRKIKNGGAFLVGVPNFNALDRWLRGVDSKVMIFPEHVNQFTQATLKDLFESAGFRVLYVGSPPPYGVALSLGLRRALRRRFGHGKAVEAVCQALAAFKKHVVYPLPNLFVEKTGLFGQSLLLLATKQG